MCGICGVFDFNDGPVSRELLQRMTDRIRHRGPDGDGFLCAGQVGLANRRLSIIDLTGGWQPQSNEDGSIQVVFNGEIYNFIELREELAKKGHIFKTRSDTEVIVHAYEQWGDDCTNHFNGIFGFALWDSKQKRLLIARDHLGVKPVYYVQLGSRLLFGSEIKALLADPACPREVDLESLSMLFTLRYVPSPRTLFKGIYKLPPGHRMVVQSSGIKIERYWKKLPQIRRGTNEAALVEEYQSLVEDAVRLQMRSDVPVGLFLSSGVDSASLLSMMSKLSNQPVRTFTIGFENGQATNETDDARQISDMFHSDHSELVLSANDYQKYYERYLWDLEEPVGNETAAAFYFVSMIASKRVKVALTGQGADEPWAGYGRYIGAKLSGTYSRLPQFLTKGLLTRVGERWVKNERWRRGLSSLYERDVLTRLVSIYSFFSTNMKDQLFQPWMKDRVTTTAAEARQALHSLHSEVRDLDPLTQILYLDTRTNLPDDLLMVGDKTSMANSLELRVPFLDYRLVEFIETLPPRLKLRGFQGKYLHKKAAEKWVPKEIIHRPKKGFANPIDMWLKTSMREFVGDFLLGEKAAINRYFNRGFVRETIENHNGNHAGRMRHIYLLLSFELWHRQFISSS